MINRIKYKSGYKYQLAEDYQVLLPVNNLEEMLEIDYISLYPSGILLLKKGYAWDGASGAKDTKNIMRGSLAHDALYQLMRGGKLPQSFRNTADDIFKKMLKEDGMSRFRIWLTYRAVRRFGKSAAKVSNKKRILIAP